MTDEKKPITRKCPFSHEAIQNPYQLHTEIREEHAQEDKPAKIVWNERIPAWMVLDYGLVKQIASDHETFSSANSIYGKDIPDDLPDVAQPLIAMDGEIHQIKRKYLQGAFKTDEIDKWEPVARKIASEQLEYIVKSRDSGALEVMKDIAIPVPIKIICEVMGIEYDDQKIQRIKNHTDAAVAFLGAPAGGRFVGHQNKFNAEDKVLLPLFIFEEIEKKKANPDDKLLSRMLKVKSDIDEATEMYHKIEMIADISLMLFAGNVTTTNLIGQCVKYLVQMPEMQQKVKQDYRFIPQLIEETLRLEAPGQASYRIATMDTEINGIKIKQGEQVYLSWGAAGRDPKKHADADAFDLDRVNKSHLAFGIGKHYCVGAKLARMEVQITLEEMFNRFEGFSIPEGYQIEYHDLPLFRGLKKLEIDTVKR